MHIVEVNRVNNRLMTNKLVIRGFTLNSCSLYMPQVGLGKLGLSLCMYPQSFVSTCRSFLSFYHAQLLQ